MIIKVCGMRDPDNIRAVEQAGADWMGFIFFPQSARYVADRPEYLPSRCRRAGIFVNENTETILSKAKEFGLDIIQLHGKETSDQCLRLKTEGLKVIKAFSLSGKQELSAVPCYEGCCDYFLFDTACTGYGGSGRTFDWKILQSYKGETPFLLSGGLRPGCMERLSRFGHPRWTGIDLNSGFETAPAQKDAVLLHTFIKQIREKIK